MDIHLQNISIDFNGVVVLNNFSPTFRHGELVSIVGRSGCGKSTLLMILAGLYKSSTGKTLFGTQNMTNVDAEKREIGMVFQNYALYPHFSVLKNIMFPLLMLKVSKEEARERAKEIAKLVRIEQLLDRKPGQLSGGQQQRVAIARALVKKPKLLLLDEPLSNLDAQLRVEMREEIRRIQQEVGITTVFVTHDQEEAMSISDRILLMKDGELQQFCEPLDMYRNPANLYVAKFLGNPQMNEIPVVLQNELLEEVVMGVRPEHIEIANTEKEVDIRGIIERVEKFGRETLIHMKWKNIALRVLTKPEAHYRVGDFFYGVICLEKVLFFHQKTGERMECQVEGGHRFGTTIHLA